ncbi:hypothetical protein ABPG72_008492 [Tetrahymena utriculariae]
MLCRNFSCCAETFMMYFLHNMKSFCTSRKNMIQAIFDDCLCGLNFEKQKKNTFNCQISLNYQKESMQINEEEKNSQFNNEQRKPQSNLIEIQQLTRTRRVFVYWPSQELKNQFIQALEQETTIQFEEYSHLDENEQCSMFKFKSGGIESQKLCEFIKKNPQFKDFQLYASKQAKFSFEKSFSSSSSCSSSINSSSFSLPRASNLLNEEEMLNDDDDANPSSDNNLYRDLNANLTSQQQDNSQIYNQ